MRRAINESRNTSLHVFYNAALSLRLLLQKIGKCALKLPFLIHPLLQYQLILRAHGAALHTCWAYFFRGISLGVSGANNGQGDEAAQRDSLHLSLH